jgi:hypothetical protein
MKNFFSINPIPKRFFSIINLMLVIFSGAILCNELKAIPEDWPSPDRSINGINCDELTMQISCIGSVQISLDQSGEAIITPAMLLVDFYPSYAKFKVVVNQTGTNQVGCSEIGKKITATVIDTTNGMMCWSSLVVEDKLRPDIICRSDTISCTNDPFLVDYSAYVFISDNCDTAVSSYFDMTLELFNCSNSNYSSVVHIKWTATDDYGNSSTCVQDIYFRKSSVDSILFPANDTVYCPNPDLNATGVPTLFGDTVSYLCQLLVTHTDDSIIVCGAMIKIRRLWTVIDWCTSTMRSQTQEILVSDTTRPDIICPPDVTIYADYFNCSANYTIPTPLVSDACSPASLLWTAVRLDNAYFLQTGQNITLSAGIHTLSYIAFDPCGNSDTCYSSVLVRDKISPSLICPPALVVSLSPSGFVILSAEFIAGKGLITDNCCLDTVLVRRMNPACGRPQDTTFRDAIEFCCDDIGSNLMIVLEALDCSGNSNFCMIQIIVQDKNPVTSSSCPTDTTLTCEQDYRNLNITGYAYAISTCLDTIYAGFIDDINIDSCSEGTVTRKFYLQFPNGTIDSSCIQIISLVNNYNFDPSDIIWPGDTALLKCSSYNPDSINSQPFLTIEDCGSVYFSYTDLSIQLTVDSCEFFERIWLAYAFCDQVIVRDTQLITILSVEHSTLRVPDDTIAVNDVGLCSAFINLQAAILTGCAANISISNSFNNGGADASGNYPVGTTIVIFTADDLCLTISDTTVVVVNDVENPVLSCRDSTVDMLPSDSIDFNVSAFVTAYSDNCTSNNLISLSFSFNDANDTTRIITCLDLTSIPDTFQIKVYIKDQAGNSDSCTAQLIITDTHQYCITSLKKGDIGGFITDGNKNPMKDVNVDLQGLNTSINTDDHGYFAFNDVITNHNYYVYPNSNKNWLEGLTTHDIIQIQRHILGIEPFDHVYKWIAADLDHNGRVTGADIVWLRKLILGITTAIPTNQSWRFVNKSYKFINSAYPLDENFEEKTMINGFWKDTMLHFDAIKVGDVSAINGVASINDRLLRKADVILENKSFYEGELFRMNVIMDKPMDIEGFQMSFEVSDNGLELYRIQEFINQSEGRNLSQDEYQFDGKNLILSLLANNSTGSVKVHGKFLSILFKARKNGNIRDMFQPATLIPNEIYPQSDVPVKILYNYKVIQEEEGEVSNWFVDPNPFKDKCYIEFNASTTEQIGFNLFDMTGKLIITKSYLITKGRNVIVIEGTDIEGVGTFLYHMRIGEHTYYGKIVKSE